MIFFPLNGVGENEFVNDRVWKVNCPGMYQCSVGNKNAIIIIPGGAYFKLNPINNGFNYAKWIKEFDCYVLLHTLPEQGKYKHSPFDQCNVSMKKLYDMGYKKVGLWGTSAGGHVAAMLDADFSILFSPVITMFEPYAHENSRNNLLGKEPSEGTNEWYSAETGVGSRASENNFIIHASDDKKVHVMNSIMYYEHLLSRGKEVEMHLFPKGDHEICLTDIWKPLLKKWLCVI